MVWREVGEKRTEKVEKSGRVFNAEETFERFDRIRDNTPKDFGQIDMTDHQVEEAEKRAQKQNEQLWKKKIR